MHIMSPDIQTRGATALGQAAMVDHASRVAVLQAGGPLALTEAMRAHLESAMVVERCLTALGALAAGDESSGGV